MQIRNADYDIDYTAIRAIRFSVFVDEQRVPADEELDDRDNACLHVLAFDAGTAVGTGRMDLEAGGKIGRIAVMASYRGRGVGTALMEYLHALAKQHGLAGVWCNAQSSAAPFYAGLGYRIVSGPFFEADIEHVRMELTLTEQQPRQP
jgi:predicted GNAT family N-acyltransferase